MPFTIPCATFARLAPVALQPDEEVEWGKTPRPFLSCLRLENRHGNRYAVASNAVILACEKLGTTDEPDAGVNVPLMPALINLCHKEAKLGSTLTVGAISAKTTFGSSVILQQIDQTYVEWWKHVPVKIATVSNAAMLLDATHIRLIAASPSGVVITQKFFDYKKPVIVRDVADPNWFGMWYDVSNTEIQMPADVPDWI